MKLKIVKEKIMIAAAAIYAGILMMPASVYADSLSQAAEGAAMGIQTSAMGIVKWVLVGVIVIAGFAFIGLGGQRAKEHQKETAWEKILGVALIVLAVPLAGLIFGWF